MKNISKSKRIQLSWRCNTTNHLGYLMMPNQGLQEKYQRVVPVYYLPHFSYFVNCTVHMILERHVYSTLGYVIAAKPLSLTIRLSELSHVFSVSARSLSSCLTLLAALWGMASLYRVKYSGSSVFSSLDIIWFSPSCQRERDVFTYAWYVCIEFMYCIFSGFREANTGGWSLYYCATSIQINYNTYTSTAY